MNQPQLLPEELRYQGYVLEVTAATDEVLAKLYPLLDRHSLYRAADSWLMNCPKNKKPKNARRFLHNWFRRSQNWQLANVKAWSEKEEAIKRETRVG